MERQKNQIRHRIWRPDKVAPVIAKGLDEHLRLGPPAAKKLAEGESRLVTVYANQKYNRSYVYANKGEEYAFTVPPGQIWFDSGINCTPEGWKRPEQDFNFFVGLKIEYMEDERRHPDADWFELVGVVGKKEQKPFWVMPKRTQGQNQEIVDRTGELFFFANDMEDRYDNNLGYVQVEVTRMK